MEDEALDYLNPKITAVVATYNRSNILRECLIALVETHLISQIVVVDDSTEGYALLNESLLEDLKRAYGYVEFTHVVTHRKNGLPRARNIGASYAKNDLIVFVDDDMLIGGREPLEAVLRDFSSVFGIGLVGGKLVEMVETKVDKPFYLNMKIADILSRTTGFVFLDIFHGPRNSEFTPALMAVKKTVLEENCFDPRYSGTSYREESDFQQSCKKLGWRLFFDPRFFAYHRGQEGGGSRIESADVQVYWKGRNHTYFTLKHSCGFKKFWYLIVGILLLMIHTPTRTRYLFSGVRDSLRTAKAYGYVAHGKKPSTR